MDTYGKCCPLLTRLPRLLSFVGGACCAGSHCVVSYSQCVPNTPAPIGCAQWNAQCGGDGFSGSTCCVDGSTCEPLNPFYNQCVPYTVELFERLLSLFASLTMQPRFFWDVRIPPNLLFCTFPFSDPLVCSLRPLELVPPGLSAEARTFLDPSLARLVHLGALPSFLLTKNELQAESCMFSISEIDFHLVASARLCLIFRFSDCAFCRYLVLQPLFAMRSQLNVHTFVPNILPHLSHASFGWFHLFFFSAPLPLSRGTIRTFYLTYARPPMQYLF